jgi:hypothetical protein
MARVFFPLSLGFPPQEKHFFRFLGRLQQSYFSPMFALELIAKPIIVPFRVLRNFGTDLLPLTIYSQSLRPACPLSRDRESVH